MEREGQMTAYTKMGVGFERVEAVQSCEAEARLVAQGSSARQVLDAAKAEGYDQPLVVHISSGPELPFGGW